MPLEPLLIRLIQNGPRQFAFEADELRDLLKRGADLFAAECSLLEVRFLYVVLILYYIEPIILSETRLGIS